MKASRREMTLRSVKWTAAGADAVRTKRTGIVILLYHQVGSGSGLQLDLAADAFEEQMRILAQEHRVVSLDDALDSLTHGHPTEPAPLVVTFDDGTHDYADVAVPTMVRYGIPSTLYVATGNVERGRAFPGGVRPLSWSALREVVSTGMVDIGSHTDTHLLLDRVDPGTVDVELDRSIGLIQDRIGLTARHFAYPKAVEGSGYARGAIRRRFASAAIGGCRPNAWGSTDPYRLRRSPIQALDEITFFRKKVAGGMALEESLRGILNRARYSSAAN